MIRSFFVALAVFSAIPTLGLAQQAPADSTDSAKVRLAPVTVTATRTTTPVYQVPLAVTVIGQQQLQDKRGYSLDEAIASVPGVFAQSRYGSSDIRLSIRGFGARGAGDRSNAGTSRGIRVLIDGIPETEPDGRTSFDLVDLAAASGIEVVRSNSSALWGNAGGGVVAIRTVPEFDHAFGRATQMAGSYGFMRTALQAGTLLGPASLAITFTNTMQDGYRAHSDSRRALANGSLTSSLGSSTDIGIFVTAANDLFHIPGPLTMEQALQDPRSANATYAARDERRYNRLARVGLTLSHDLSSERSISGMLFVNPKILQRSERGTYRDFNRHHVGGNLVYRADHSLGNGMSGETVAGADGAVQDGTVLFYSLTPRGTRGTELRDNKAEGAMNLGVFAQERIRFSEQLDLDVGARWDKIRYDYRSFIDPGLDAVKSFSRVTPRVGLNLRLSPTHSLYASVGGGIEAPAGNETDPASTFGQDTVTAINPLLEPIHSTTYEVGTKQLTILSGGPLTTITYEVALYDTRVTNEIVPYRGGRFYFTAGRASRMGAELGATLAGSSDLEITGSATFSRNRYVRYTVDSVHYGRPGKSADYSGNDIAGVPSSYYSLAASRTISQRVPVAVRAMLRGVGDYFIDDANAVKVPGYRILNVTLSTGRDIPIGSFAIRAFVTAENALNRRYIGSAFVNPDVVNGVPVAFEPGAGRGWTFSLSLGHRDR
jgi:iron complex outermembrane receptor protein